MQSLADEHCNPPCITSHSTASSHPPFLVGWVSSYLGCFLRGGFWALISVFLFCLSCCGKACSKIIPCRVYDARLCQMDNFACYQMVCLMVAGVTVPCSLCLFFIHVPFNLHQLFG